MIYIGLLYPIYCSHLAHKNFFLSSDLNRILPGKKGNDNEEVIIETEIYLKQSKSYYKNLIV